MKCSRIKRVLFTLLAGIMLAMVVGVCYYQPFFPNDQDDEDVIWCLKLDGTPHAVTTHEEYVKTPSLNNSLRFGPYFPTIRTPIYQEECYRYFVDWERAADGWNIVKKENLSDVSCGRAPFEPPVKMPYRPVWSNLSHHILFEHRFEPPFEPPFEGEFRGGIFEQRTAPEKYKDATSLIFLENFSESAYTWEQFPFEHYMSGDAHLLCWVYSEKHHGFFMVWEVHSANRNELLYYDLNTHHVCGVKNISIVADQFFQIGLMQGENYLFIFSANYVEIYSIPDFNLAKRVLLAYRTYADAPMSVSSDLRYIAFGDQELFLMDTYRGTSLVLDPLYSRRLNMDFLYFSLDCWDKHALLLPYLLVQIQFVNDTHILSAVSGRGEYYRWDADTHDRIAHDTAKNIIRTSKRMCIPD